MQCSDLGRLCMQICEVICASNGLPNGCTVDERLGAAVQWHQIPVMMHWRLPGDQRPVWLLATIRHATGVAAKKAGQHLVCLHSLTATRESTQSQGNSQHFRGGDFARHTRWHRRTRRGGLWPAAKQAPNEIRSNSIQARWIASAPWKCRSERKQCLIFTKPVDAAEDQSGPTQQNNKSRPAYGSRKTKATGHVIQVL
jgi:hypothetical protein